MATVKLTVAMSGARSWVAGDEYECGDAEAARLVAMGRAVPIAPKIERAVKAPVVEKRKK